MYHQIPITQEENVDKVRSRLSAPRKSALVLKWLGTESLMVLACLSSGQLPKCGTTQGTQPLRSMPVQQSSALHWQMAKGYTEKRPWQRRCIRAGCSNRHEDDANWHVESLAQSQTPMANTHGHMVMVNLELDPEFNPKQPATAAFCWPIPSERCCEALQ